MERRLDTRTDAVRVSFEFFPPSEPSGAAAFWTSVHRLVPAQPRFISVTYGAAGSSRERTRQCVSEILARTPLRAAPHLTCVGATRAEINELAADYWRSGVKDMVALRGDGLNGERFIAHPGGFASAVELVEAVRRVAPFDISVAAYPETHPEAESMAADVDHLKRKIDAGASRAITQFFFDIEAFLRFRDACDRAVLKAPIVPGILPIVNFNQTARFAKRCGASIPRELACRFNGLDNDPVTHQLVSAAVVIGLVERLQREGVTDFHFYTLNRAELTFAVCQTLGLFVSQRASSSA